MTNISLHKPIALFILIFAAAILASAGGTGSASAAGLREMAAPNASTKVNVIAMPLNATQQFASAGQTFNAAGLATIIGSGVEQVLSWNPDTGSYRAWYPSLAEGNNFALEVGGVYRLVLTSTAENTISLVGELPAQSSVQFGLVRPSSGSCRVNDISVPLDRSNITNAQQLANSVGYVEQVLEWNASAQAYRAWYPDLAEGNNFTVRTGYPYRLCLKASGMTAWPDYD